MPTAFVHRFVGLAAAATIALFGLMLLLDPYDTGRFTFLKHSGVFETGPRFSNASRGRDPRFNAAVLGNSTIQLVSPERLDAMTGARFVQLSTPGSSIRETFALLDYFVRHQPTAPAAVVIGLGLDWCGADPSFPLSNPFPFWLYDASPWTYARNLFRFDTLQALPRRVAQLSGLARRARPDGYWDYETDARRPRPSRVPDLVRFDEGSSIPAAAALAAALARLPASTAVTLVHPPVYTPAMPTEPPQTEVLARCLARFEDVARNRPRTRVIERWSPDPFNAAADNFFDAVHYKGVVARALDHAIAGALRETMAER